MSKQPVKTTPAKATFGSAISDAKIVDGIELVFPTIDLRMTCIKINSRALRELQNREDQQALEHKQAKAKLEALKLKAIDQEEELTEEELEKLESYVMVEPAMRFMASLILATCAKASVAGKPIPTPSEHDLEDFLKIPLDEIAEEGKKLNDWLGMSPGKGGGRTKAKFQDAG